MSATTTPTVAPTLAGFLAFVASTGVPPEALPADSLYPGWAYNIALQLVPAMAVCIGGDIYTVMVYNLAMANLVAFAQDVLPGTTPPYFATLRTALGLDAFVPGLVQSASDQGTANSLMIPDFFKNITLADLQYLKTPWGRAYLALAQSFGTVWGLN